MRKVFLTLLVSLLAALPAAAQSEAGAGTITGLVLDPSGAPVAGARITATAAATGLQRTAVSTEGGLFTLVRLPAGTYDVTVEKEGFKQLRRSGVVVAVGSVTPVDARLEIGAVTESVTVTAEAALVETSRTQTSTVVGEKLVRDLPINGRNFLDFVTLTPGVVRDPRGGDLSFGGQRGTVNSFLIDGTDSNNLFFGQSTGRQGVRNPLFGEHGRGAGVPGEHELLRARNRPRGGGRDQRDHEIRHQRVPRRRIFSSTAIRISTRTMPSTRRTTGPARPINSGNSGRI